VKTRGGHFGHQIRAHTLAENFGRAAPVRVECGHTTNGALLLDLRRRVSFGQILRRRFQIKARPARRRIESELLCRQIAATISQRLGAGPR